MGLCTAKLTVWKPRHLNFFYPPLLSLMLSTSSTHPHLWMSLWELELTLSFSLSIYLQYLAIYLLSIGLPVSLFLYHSVSVQSLPVHLSFLSVSLLISVCQIILQYFFNLSFPPCICVPLFSLSRHLSSSVSLTISFAVYLCLYSSLAVHHFLNLDISINNFYFSFCPTFCLFISLSLNSSFSSSVYYHFVYLSSPIYLSVSLYRLFTFYLWWGCKDSETETEAVIQDYLHCDAGKLDILQLMHTTPILLSSPLSYHCFGPIMIEWLRL